MRARRPVYTLSPTDALRLSLGVRGDWIRDRFDPAEGEGGGEGGPEGGGSHRASHGAASPKAGVNVRWFSTESQTGHHFVTAGRSFKAPTLDQLFDQRAFPLPVPPFSVSPSNPDLVPQGGRHVEVGLYHSARWMDGCQLKAIPRRVVDGGVSGVPLVRLGRLEVGLRVSHARGVHLYAENTIELPSFTRTDLRISRPVAGVSLFLDVRNLFDVRFSTTGDPDPGGSGAVYYFPSAGRTFQLGVRSGRQ